MFSNLLSSINDNIYDSLDDLVFINSDITKSISKIIGQDFSSGMILICNSLIYGFLIYYAISYLLSHLTFTPVENPVQFIFKLLLCAFALNASEYICSGIIFICSYISDMICEIGNFIFRFDVSFAYFLDEILPSKYFTSNSFSLFSFDGIIKSAVSFGFLNLTVSYAIRYIALKALMIISPFAILSLASQKTSCFFKSWFKTFLAMALLQVFVAVILVVCYAVDYIDKIVPPQIMHLGMIYTLFKANSFMRDLIGGFSTDVSLNVPNISSLLKGVN